MQAALAHYPKAASGWLALSDMKTFKAGDPDLERMEALMRPGEIEAHSDRVAMNFALGKAWMDADDAAKAFAYLNAGNRLHRQTIAFDPEAAAKCP